MNNHFLIKQIRGSISVPGDKSISHRAVMLSSLATGTVRIENLLESEDVLNTVKIFQQCGIEIKKIEKNYYINGKGLFGLSEAGHILDVGNSGTTLRLMCGILSGQNFYSVLTGDDSILKRPVKRIIRPLQKMNIRIFSRMDNGYPPVTILPSSQIKSIKYELPVASAQVKSAILFAGLYSKKKVIIIEKTDTRDHTERMFQYFNIPLKKNKEQIILNNRQMPFQGRDIFIPGDFSSASYFIVGALLAPASKITINDLSLNPTRIGLFNVLRRMGAKINLSNIRKKNNEEIGTVSASSSELKGTGINPEEIPLLIDEIPILSIAALKAKGFTVLKGAGELRVKESDRIRSIVENLKVLGANIRERDDGFIINGEKELKEKKLIKTYKDHRIAMSFIMASSLLKKGIIIEEIDSIKTSFPSFIKLLNKVNQ
ncbi:MAG: 3-phosphoshikimate 1-carboxyvinyltransferase [bacterium]|nr:3-phosphoshikimate 1-carboxyvinyltransferase [bacterium]